jgi:hypothetical protein
VIDFQEEVKASRVRHHVATTGDAGRAPELRPIVRVAVGPRLKSRVEEHLDREAWYAQTGRKEKA